MTSKIVSSVRTLEAKSYAPNFVSLAYRKWGTQLQKSEQLTDRSGRLNPKIVPDFECRPHCRKAGSFSVVVFGIFYNMLKGYICSEESLSMERGGWKCSGIRDYITSALSAMTEILLESARYSEKAMWGWYAIHTPGSGKKRCCVSAVRYLSSGSEEKALSRWIARMFLTLGWQ